MKKILIIIVIVIISSCKSEPDCFDCYINQFDKKQSSIIKKVHIVFDDFLDKNYPNKIKAKQIHAYLQNIKSPQEYQYVDTFNITTTIKLCQGYGIINDEYPYDITRINEKHFIALKNCLKYDYSDSLIYNYLNSYEITGDVNPGGFFPYFLSNSSDLEFERKVFRNILILELFIPEMIEKFKP